MTMHYPACKHLIVALFVAIISAPHGVVAKTSSTGMIHRTGQRLVNGDGTAIHLRGVNLLYDRVSQSYCGGGDWRLADHTDWGIPVDCWYQEKHFRLLRKIGFNSVRINLSYRIFEDNSAPGRWKPSAWALLDRLLGWGKKYGLYLILDMHIAPGGAGIIACRGCGYRTWDEPGYQQRLISLWKAIAARYAGEPQIAAYSLMNEPAPTHRPQQWQTLAQRLVDAIRTVDRQHLLIVEMVQWIFDRNNHSVLGDMNLPLLRKFQFLVNDAQIIYDSHFYLPKAYTLQDEQGIDGGRYPAGSITEISLDGRRMQRNKRYLSHEMALIQRYWHEKNVPAIVAEWGTTGQSDKGEIQYTREMLQLLDADDLHWQFYSIDKLYRIDCCFVSNPTFIRDRPLIDLFRRYFESH